MAGAVELGRDLADFGGQHFVVIDQRILAERPIEISIGSLQGSLRFRIGLHYGEVKVQKSKLGSEYIGTTVAKAVYIEDLAEPGRGTRIK